MEGLDRLGWAEGVAFGCHGVAVGLRASDFAVLEAAMAKLPPGWVRRSSPVVDRLYSVVGGGSVGRGGKARRLTLVYAGSQRISREREEETALDALEIDLRHYVAEASPTRVFVHAGVVGWRGSAIVIPGKSFSGKTTLVAELVRRGAVYYSDEYAVLDRRGRVLPFAKPLSIRTPGVHGSDDQPVQDIGGVPGTRPLPVGVVAVTEFRSGIRWRHRTMTPGEGALALLGNTVAARSQPARAMEVLRRAVSTALILEGRRGEAAPMAEMLLARADAFLEAGRMEVVDA